MRGGASRVCLLFIVAILLTLLYPALFLDCSIAPEASLKSAPPWRELSGPLPKPSAEAFDAATQLGPRLASLARKPLGVALWNPWIGGGRPGWLAGPEQGGAPLVLLSAVVARPRWAWTGLIALELTAALLTTWWTLRLLGLGAWPAAVGATAYAFSGAVTGHWLDWQGSALALGPLALVPAISPPRGKWRSAGVWALAVLVLAACGAPAMAFVALAAAIAILFSPRGKRSSLWLPAALAAALVFAVALPRIWLAGTGGEPGAPAPTLQTMPPIRSWVSAIVAQPAPDESAIPVGVGELQARSDSFAYVGLGTMALAVLGLLAAPPRTRGFWLGVAGVSAAVVSVPSSILTHVGLYQRPYGVLALSVATLAAYGAQALTDRLHRRTIADALSAAVWVLLSLSLVSKAAHHLPFIPSEDTELAAPLPRSVDTQTWRLVGLLGTMPPDSAALLGLADVRASSFPREPHYALLVGGGRGGEIPVSRGVNSRMVRLGARWLLEPLPLRVVSGEVCSRIEIAELAKAQDGQPDRATLHLHAVVPYGATRLGVPSEAGRPVRARLETAGRNAELDPDDALQAESAAWTWFSVPVDFPSGPTLLTVFAGHPLSEGTLPVAWDTSGLLLGPEQRGVRVWEWATVKPFAFLARGLMGETASPPADHDVVTVPDARVAALGPLAGGVGNVKVVGVEPAAVEARGDLAAPGLLVFRIKYRPALWKAAVNGSPARSERVDGVWTGVALPAGPSRVELKAQLPPQVWGVASAALIAIVLLAAPRRLA